MIKIEIRCSKCKQIKYIGADIYHKLLAKYGSEEKLRHYWKCCNGLIPYGGKIQCTICKNSFAVRTEVYRKRIKIYGSEEKLLNSYKCRRCRKKIKRENNMNNRVSNSKK